jgi:hypothetical protein
MAKKRVAKVQPIKPKNGDDGAKQARQPARPQTHTFLVDGNVLQQTVELLAALQLAHPGSIKRDQLVTYYTSLKSIESIGASNDSG